MGRRRGIVAQVTWIVARWLAVRAVKRSLRSLAPAAAAGLRRRAGAVAAIAREHRGLAAAAILGAGAALGGLILGRRGRRR
jgi:hypothetical protein